jgi:hypothetical protein
MATDQRYNGDATKDKTGKCGEIYRECTGVLALEALAVTSQ